MKKYLLVISRCGEDETYLYESLEDLLKHWNCKSIEDVLNMRNFLTSYCIFEISKSWCKNYE